NNGNYEISLKTAGLEFYDPQRDDSTFHSMTTFSTNSNYQFYTSGDNGVLDFTGAKVKGLTVASSAYAANAGNAATLGGQLPSYYSVSGHTHSQYSLTSHTHGN